MIVPASRSWAISPKAPDRSVHDTTNWFGIVAPAKAKPEVVDRVRDGLSEVMRLPDLQQRMSALGFNLDYLDSDQFRERIAMDHHRYGVIIRNAGIRPD